MAPEDQERSLRSHVRYPGLRVFGVHRKGVGLRRREDDRFALCSRRLCLRRSLREGDSGRGYGEAMMEKKFDSKPTSVAGVKG